MISLVESVPRVSSLSAEHIKLRTVFEAYKSDALFWAQNGDEAFLSLIDGNMVVFNNSPLNEERRLELSEFLEVINPACVFSDYGTLSALGLVPKEPVFVMHKVADNEMTEKSDSLSSNMLYDILNVEGLSLPDYEHFAVDICYRLNHGMAEYFGIKSTCAAISFNTDNFAIMNGIASHKKGYGTVALNNILAKNKGRNFLVCCRESVKGFYEKNGFTKIYMAGYWVRE